MQELDSIAESAALGPHTIRHNKTQNAHISIILIHSAGICSEAQLEQEFSLGHLRVDLLGRQGVAVRPDPDTALVVRGGDREVAVVQLRQVEFAGCPAVAVRELIVVDSQVLCRQVARSESHESIHRSDDPRTRRDCVLAQPVDGAAVCS